MSDGLTPEQRRVLGVIVKRGRAAGASPKELKAAVETGLVEANLTNPSGGDADSRGWRQERDSGYKGDGQNLTRSVDRFFKETHAVKDKYGSAGQLAAAVQRPAAQFRGRYQGKSGQADALLGRGGAAGGSARTVTTPGVDNSSARGQALAQWVLSNNTDPVAAATALAAVPADVAPTSRTIKNAAPGTSATGAPGAPQAATTGGASGAVTFARQHIGAYKESAGSNRGPQLNTLQGKFGYKGGGAPWCAMFTSVAVTRGGAPASARTASVGEIRKQALTGNGGYEQGLKSKPRAGDLMIFGQTQHVGMVESVNADGSVNTIEGNTSSGKVARVRRGAGSGEFARPKYRR